MSNDNSVIWFWLVVAAAAIAYFFFNEWVHREYASIHYAVPMEKITVVGKRPYDCDFSTAPLGYKHCSYEREYAAEWVTLSTQNVPIVYGTLQETPPLACSDDPNDFARRCYVTELKLGERATSNWTRIRIEIRWRKVED